MTTPDVPAERGRDELRDAIASALYNEFRVGKMPDYRPMWHEVEEATRAKYRAMTNVLLEPFAALLAPQKARAYYAVDRVPDGYERIEAYRRGDEIVVLGQPDTDDERHNCDEQGCGSLSHVLARFSLDAAPQEAPTDAHAPVTQSGNVPGHRDPAVQSYAAPQEAREGGAEWVADYSRLLTAYKGAVVEYYGLPGAGFATVEAAEKMRAARAELDAHVLAAARPVPETREPDGLPELVAKLARRRDRLREKGDEAEFEERHRYHSMAGELDIVLDELSHLGAPAPAEATEREPELLGYVVERQRTPGEWVRVWTGRTLWFDHDEAVLERDAYALDGIPARIRGVYLGAPAPAEATERSES